jgi:hypothetical protein
MLKLDAEAVPVSFLLFKLGAIIKYRFPFHRILLLTIRVLACLNKHGFIVVTS